MGIEMITWKNNPLPEAFQRKQKSPLFCDFYIRETICENQV
jgi:hypothetical protein